MTPETRTELAELKARIAQFEKKEAQDSAGASDHIDASFAHGTEEVAVEISHTGMTANLSSKREHGELTFTWDEIIEILGPFMLDEAPDPDLRKKLNSHALRTIRANNGGLWTTGWSHESSYVSDKSWGSIIIQLRALRMITMGTKKRTVSDKAVYWKLTPAGDDYLVALRAVPSTTSSSPQSDRA